MNPRIGEIEGSVIRALNERKKPTSIDLGLGEPTLLPNMRYLEAATQWVAEHGCRYTPNAGEPELREAIAQHYRYPGFDSSQNVIVTAGSQEALYLCIKSLLDPARDSVLIVEPAFPVYAKCAQMEGIQVERVSLTSADGFAFDAERIAAALTSRSRLIVLCSPCNPTARVISRAQAERLANLLQRRGGDTVYVLHDEVYRELLFTGDAGWLAAVYPNTVVVNSLSKSNALTGLRLGWILASAPFIEQATKVHAWVASCTDAFAQRVGLAVFESGAVEEHRSWYVQRHREMLSCVRDSGLRFIAPDGAFYVCVRLPAGTSSLEAAMELVERYDVVAIPGIAFGACFEGWLRLSWVAPLDVLREGLTRIAAFCAEAIA